MRVGSWELRALLLLLLLAGCERPSAIRPEAVWLETGTAPGQAVYPRALAYDEKNDWLYVVDRSAHVQRLDAATGTVLASWFMPDHLQGKPVGLSVGPDGLLYVPDTHYHRVIVFDPDGREVRRWGSKGHAPGQFIYPTDIAFDAEGNLYVGEYGDNDRIQVFAPAQGADAPRVLRTFGRFGQGDGEFSRPQSLAIRGDELFITDSCNHRLLVFRLDGTFVRAMGTVGTAPGEFRFPYGLEFAPDGNLLVTEFGNNRLQRLSPDGKPLAMWGVGGRAVGELAYPWAVIIDKRGRAIIADAGNNRLVVVRF